MKKKIKILYEDKDVLVIDKPAGIALHDDAEGNQEYTIADWVVENRPEMREIGEPHSAETLRGKATDDILRPGIVHRLDKDTSGVMVLAKTQSAYKFLKRQFQSGEVRKVYQAIIYGGLKNESGIIDRPIGRSRSDFTAKAAGSRARGEIRKAVTYYKVIKRYDGYSLLELRPKTGRTHQLRVHLKSVSHPIVCDAVYAKGQPCLPGLKRQALHSFSIGFRSLSGKDIKIESPLPVDVKEAIANLRPL